MTRLLLLLLLIPGLAAAQDQRSGSGPPAANAQVPPSAPAPDRGRTPDAAPGDRDARTGADDARTAPPPGHVVMPAPAVPGARQPERSEGFGGARDRVPPDIGRQVRPNASTTGR
ncbi:hypothetical protein [Falsiroseomonas sp. HW251]|uniref:hypothetical protein n=1 Tax=Falsiroseomonas sp. HW251 TaxID=3390998 RepID=UPI003D3112FF